ncbi:hypothetical protein CAPTEDRAFT_172092 [Capitella teleta]|uniref:Rab-GAP TBC domain-containing protein n=1 Tax=Capitella teleta TaxID=283909 RepID=R7UAQ6_CAPTE|nr:hypothetical protein CAPTEDRAFT_172092 [Capitella teleta]|eukprot:ELU03415.1 hypothetical protein CAPTEDRAFT_172092 [Capitella teleta]
MATCCSCQNVSCVKQDLEKDISAHVKWENYLVSLGNRPLQQSADLKLMIRTGVPMEYRSRVWKACIDWRSSNLRLCCGDQHYNALLEQVEIIQSSPVVTPLSRQIEVDLLRTLPDNKHYESCTSAGIPKLRRILLAYSVHNPDVGYCQGLNRVAAIALLFLSEEDAFWSLVSIVESLMPRGYYAQSLIAAHADQRVLKDIVADKLPRLTAHLEQHRVDLSLFTFNWFMTIFVDNIPVETFLRIWDTFLYEGSKVLFRYAVAFLKYREEDLLSKTSDLQLHEYLRSIGDTMTDVNRIAQIAFNELNPFPMRTIHSRRQSHLLKIQVGFQ